MRQPRRALVVTAVYLTTVALLAVPTLLVLGRPLGWLILFAFASVLSVPVAIVAPLPRPEQDASSSHPVLRRPSDR
jgi:hypothetical protein